LKCIIRVNFRPYDPSQPYILPQSLDDWLPEGHLARFISDTVDNLDLTEFYKYYRANGQGSSAYHPRMMVKVLLYAYCVGVCSSRKIARALVDDVAFRWLGAGNFPDFRTISEFRRKHLKAFQGLFSQVLVLCKVAGLLKVGVVALDGTKVKANASLSKNRTYDQLLKEEEEINKKVKELLDRAEKTDQEEDELYGDMRGDELPPELSNRKSRLKKIREAKAELEARSKAKAAEQKTRNKEQKSGKEKRGGKSKDSSAKPDGRSRINTTDFDSRVQKTKGGYIQGYNAQAVVNEDQVIIAQTVVSDENDIHQLIPMVEQTEETLKELGESPKTFLADAGYCSNDNFLKVENKDYEVLVPTKAERKQRTESGGSIRGRKPDSARARMERKLKNPVRAFVYGFRSRMIEPVFGQMKFCRGLKGFLLRGLEKVQGEFSMWCTSHNLLKLFRNQGIARVSIE